MKHDGRGNEKLISVAICALLLSLSFHAEAQQVKKVPRIGYVSNARFSDIPRRVEAFRQGLHELGYVEGKNIFIEYRHAEGKYDRLPSLAAELVQLNVDIIVTASTQAAQAGQQATRSIPIVMTNVSDPVESGLVG